MEAKKKSNERKQPHTANRTAGQMRSRFLKVRRLAAQLAAKCDFVALDSIRCATASCTAESASVVVPFRDIVERSQIVTAFTWGTSLEYMNFSCNGYEDIKLRNGARFVCMDFR